MLEQGLSAAVHEQLNLDSSVERARVGYWRRVWNFL